MNKTQQVLEEALNLLEIAHSTSDEYYSGEGVEYFIEKSRSLLYKTDKTFKVSMHNGENHYVSGGHIWSMYGYYHIGAYGECSVRFCKEEVKCILPFEI